MSQLAIVMPEYLRSLLALVPPGMSCPTWTAVMVSDLGSYDRLVLLGPTLCSRMDCPNFKCSSIAASRPDAVPLTQSPTIITA
jgi:hypothetical protein